MLLLNRIWDAVVEQDMGCGVCSGMAIQYPTFVGMVCGPHYVSVGKRLAQTGQTGSHVGMPNALCAGSAAPPALLQSIIIYGKIHLRQLNVA